jgi:hypothetical protein
MTVQLVVAVAQVHAVVEFRATSVLKWLQVMGLSEVLSTVQ